MKRLIVVIALCVMTVLSATNASAQRYGLSAGANFTSMQDVDKSSAVGYVVGGTVQFSLPHGFSIQPSLPYSAKSSEVESNVLSTLKMGVGYLELPVSVQWGPDLLLFRPFLDVTPYIGCALNKNIKTVADDLDLGLSGLNQLKGEALEAFKEGFGNMVNDLEYGLGVGGGLEFWKLQLVCRYNWNFGPLVKVDKKEVSEVIQQQINDAVKGKNFGGVSLSLTFMFGK